jgi:hypothetical protein
MITKNKTLPTNSSSLGEKIVETKKKKNIWRFYVTFIYPLYAYNFLAIDTSCGAFNKSI